MEVEVGGAKLNQPAGDLNHMQKRIVMVWALVPVSTYSIWSCVHHVLAGCMVNEITTQLSILMKDMKTMGLGPRENHDWEVGKRDVMTHLRNTT